MTTIRNGTKPGDTTTWVRVDSLTAGDRIRYAVREWTVTEVLQCAGIDQPAVIGCDPVTLERRVLIYTHAGAVAELFGRAS